MALRGYELLRSFYFILDDSCKKVSGTGCRAGLHISCTYRYVCMNGARLSYVLLDNRNTINRNVNCKIYFSIGPVLSLAVAPDGDYCFSGGIDATIRCWNMPHSSIDPYDSYGM